MSVCVCVCVCLCACVSDQVAQLSEVPTDRVKDSQQDVDVGRVELSRI